MKDILVPAVPNLLLKLNVLIDYAGFKNMDALAQAFEREPKSLYSWARAGAVPTASYKILIAIVFDALNGSLADREVDALLSAESAFPLLEEILSVPARPISELIEAEADRQSGALFVKRAQMGLIETERQAAQSSPHAVRLGGWFRIEFATSLAAGNVLCLQHGGQLWGGVPHEFDGQSGIIRLPDNAPDGDPGHMREQSDTGQHQFVAVQTIATFPAAIRHLLIDRTAFDNRVLNRLVNHYQTQPPAQRRLFALDITIQK